jgi:hypothetical protein
MGCICTNQKVNPQTKGFYDMNIENPNFKPAPLVKAVEQVTYFNRWGEFFERLFRLPIEEELEQCLQDLTNSLRNQRITPDDLKLLFGRIESEQNLQYKPEDIPNSRSQELQNPGNQAQVVPPQGSGLPKTSMIIQQINAQGFFQGLGVGQRNSQPIWLDPNLHEKIRKMPQLIRQHPSFVNLTSQLQFMGITSPQNPEEKEIFLNNTVRYVMQRKLEAQPGDEVNTGQVIEDYGNFVKRKGGYRSEIKGSNLPARPQESEMKIYDSVLISGGQSNTPPVENVVDPNLIGIQLPQAGRPQDNNDPIDGQPNDPLNQA